MIGVYIHIPFCIKKCSYCDFYSISDYSCQEKYFEALKNEIIDFGRKNGKLKIDTVFFGGGTPSSVDGKYITDIISTLKASFIFKENTEITIEANPKTFNEEKLYAYREAGINRLSIGLQSANEEKLKILGRIHNLDEFEKSYYMAKNTGFSNINVDIMYGLPNETQKSLNKTLDALLEYNPSHISAYALTLSENTPIYKMKYNYPDDDTVFENYLKICEKLSDYRHYEISNFGKIVCQHNMIYWKREEFLGFGASASGFYKNIRYTNKKNIKSYIENYNDKESFEEMSENDAVFETIMLSLRIDEGLDLINLKEKYNCDLYGKNSELIDSLIKGGYMKKTPTHISLTDKGFFVSNSIISSLKY